MRQNAHIFFYLANEDGNALSLSRDLLHIRENSLLAFGSQTDIGSWHLHLKSMVCCGQFYSVRENSLPLLKDGMMFLRK